MAIFGRVATALVVVGAAHGVLGHPYPDCMKAPMSQNEVCSMHLSPAERAAHLVKAMTIEEKLVNLVDHSLGAERIGLPKYDWWSEALHGVAFSPGVHFADAGNFSSATSFPNPITLSAAFDDRMVERVGLVIGAEARAFANAGRAGLDFWTPNINPFKDPRWGRGLETPGEDPFRIANYVKHLLRGMEWASEDPEIVEKRQVVATCKHYAAYDLERWNGVVRYSFDAVVSLQDLVEYYLPPFRQCARDSNVGSIMCSYNRVNGTPACASEYLMQTVLREHWNWTEHNNYIVSDCNAVHNIYADHKWVKTAAQAVAAAMNAGTDNTCEAGGWTTDVIGAYNQSLLKEEVIDRALRRQYEGLIRADYFASWREGEPEGFRTYEWDYVNTDVAKMLAHQAAANGIVMLKNDGTLPVKFSKNQTVAVVGHWANDTKTRMLGNYNGRPPYYHTPLYAAQQLGLNVKYADGPVSNTGNYSEAIAAAKASDIILYFGGIDTSIETEDRDRTTIDWPEAQLQLLRELSALNKPIVVIQLGTQIDNTPLLQNKNINSILWTGYPGMDGGTAAFDIITGTIAPAGRLPITQYPANYTSQVPMTDMTLRPSAKNPGRTYKWYKNAVQEFGFGLHYTNFTVKFSGPYGGNSSTNSTVLGMGKKRNSPTVFDTKQILQDCNEKHKDLCTLPPIPITITNTGKIRSDYIALVFLSTTNAGPTPHPIKELAAYKRVRNIKAGEEREVELQLSVGSVARINERGDTVLYPGTYCLAIDVPERERGCFEITGGDVVLDSWPQPKAGGNGTAVARARGF